MTESNHSQQEYPPNLQNLPEIADGISGTITGTIPTWLKGSLLTCGPGLFHFKDMTVKHLLDGMAMLGNIEIDGASSSVNIKQKFLKSKTYENGIENGKPDSVLMGTPKKVQPLRPFGPYEFTDNCLGLIHEENPGEIFLQSDGSTWFFTIDPNTLEPIEKNHYLKTFGLYSMRALPLEDENGDLYNLGGTITGSLECQVLRMKKEDRKKPIKERWEIISRIPSRMKTNGSILRCLAITKNYVIFIEQPVVVNAMKMTSTYIKDYTMIDWLEWHPDLCNRFHIVSKETGEAIKVEFVSFYAFYGVAILNAYEDEHNNIVVDCVALPNLDVMKALFLENLMNPNKETEDYENIFSGSITRFVVPIINNLGDAEEDDNYIADYYDEAEALRKGDKIVLIPQVIFVGVDFAVVNPRFSGKNYRFAYSINAYTGKDSEEVDHAGNCIRKVDLETQATQVWTGKEGQVPSLPIFIPNPDSNEEDDGVLVFGMTQTAISNNEESENSIVVLDAKSFTEAARVTFKDKILTGWIHGLFLKAHS